MSGIQTYIPSALEVTDSAIAKVQSLKSEEENENFSDYSTVSKRPSQKQFQNICEIAKTKGFFVSTQKVLLSSSSSSPPR